MFQTTCFRLLPLGHGKTVLQLLSQFHCLDKKNENKNGIYEHICHTSLGAHCVLYLLPERCVTEFLLERQFKKAFFEYINSKASKTLRKIIVTN